MNRRDLIVVIVGLVVPALGSAQPVASMRRIAILDPADRALRADQWQDLEARLRELGYVEGRNLAIERRWANGSDARLPQLAQELLAGKPEVVLVITTPATQALMHQTNTIPIVMTGTADPVAAGLVDALARPGRNVTGVSVQSIVELAARYRIPAGYVDAEFLDAGGLLVFGPTREASYRHAAEYVYRILQGANPAEMPVMQPTEFWLGINLQTAKSLGLKIPQSVLVRANRVIE